MCVYISYKSMTFRLFSIFLSDRKMKLSSELLGMRLTDENMLFLSIFPNKQLDFNQ